MKEKYTTPEAIVVEQEDIIRTSNETPIVPFNF